MKDTERSKLYAVLSEQEKVMFKEYSNLVVDGAVGIVNSTNDSRRGFMMRLISDFLAGSAETAFNCYVETQHKEVGHS